MMDEPRVTKGRPGTLSKTACVTCRHLKMKCEISHDRSCFRCKKAGRRCTFPTPALEQTTNPALAQTQTPKEPQKRAQAPAQFSYLPHDDASSLIASSLTPSYSASANFAVPFSQSSPWNPLSSSLGFQPPSHLSPAILTRSVSQPTGSTPKIVQPVLSATRATTPTIVSPVQSGTWFNHSNSSQLLLTPVTSILPESQDPGVATLGLKDNGPKVPTDEEMSYLCRFFINNFLVHISILTIHDVGDYPEMVKRGKRLLACTMAYTAARFVPGCKAIQRMLFPEILAITRPLSSHSDDETCWTTLQAYAVLYNWTAQGSTSDYGASEASLKDEDFSTSRETFIRQFSLHKSAEQLARLLKQEQVDFDVRQTFAFRKYLFWLWMFGVTHFRSLLARMPPQIREDSTIRVGRYLLRDHINDDKVSRILAQVELCLLWSEAGLRACGLGEWWCSLPNDSNLESTLALLNDMDNNIEIWRNTWCPVGQTTSDHNIVIEFDWRFTRFCFGAHLSRTYQCSAIAGVSPAPSLDLVTDTVNSAAKLVQYLLELTPLSKASLRFVPEESFAMISLGYQHMLCAHEQLPDLDIIKFTDLTSIHGLGELMVELGVDNKHTARVCGRQLLVQLRSKLQAASMDTRSFYTSKHQAQSGRIPTSASSEQRASLEPLSWKSAGALTIFDSLTALDKIWPVSLPAPTPRSGRPKQQTMPSPNVQTKTVAGQLHDSSVRSFLGSYDGLPFSPDELNSTVFDHPWPP